MSMAMAARFSPLACFNVRLGIRATQKPKTSVCKRGRRQLLLSSTAPTIALILAPDSRTQLLNKFLKKSQENKAKNDKERLDSYYKRNYKDYFGLLEGELKQKQDLSESEKGILEWLEANK